MRAAPVLEPVKAHPSKTLEELEGDAWDGPEFDSYLVATCRRLRKKPIGEFAVEDLRVMIGQDIGTRFLVSLALDALETDPLAEGDFYPSDLLSALVGLPDAYWRQHADHRKRALSIVSRALDRLESSARGASSPSDRSLSNMLRRFRAANSAE